MTDWIEWDGGKRPVPPDALIEVRYRDGSTDSGLAWEWNQRWSHGDDPTDIVAYRVISGAAKPENDGWIEWDGGKRPVPEDTLVEVRHRNGDTDWGLAEEWDACWRNDEDPQDTLVKAQDYLRWAIAGKAEGKR